ncbi:MAG: zinc ribbon domain-containing protein [Chloroflexia bacterium]|nr:zinc ribbon domain-containing protein [Chloroflexia bacterium]
MVSCPRCGSENAAGSNYCYNCGTSLRSSGGDGAEAPAPVADASRPFMTSSTEDLRGRSEAWGAAPAASSSAFPTQEDAEPRRRRSRWVTIPLVLFAILLITCVGLFAFGLTEPGREVFDNVSTWAVEEATQQSERR